MTTDSQNNPAPSGTDQLTEEEKADLVCLATFPSSHAAHQAGTVILTQDYWYAVFQAADKWGLYVRSAIAKDASKLVQKNLSELDTASLIWPVKPAPPPKTVGPWHLIPAPLLFMIVYGISVSDKGTGLVETGRFDSIRILENGEWWRLVTPLFLHGDTTHLLGNVVGGLLFGGLLATRVGAAKTYLIAILTGIVGNGLNLLTYHNTPHYSIGSSTAVFGLLGALIGLRLRDILHKNTPHNPFTRKHCIRLCCGVLGIGFLMLSLMGSGGENTDVPAHLYGFISGLILLFSIRIFTTTPCDR